MATTSASSSSSPPEYLWCDICWGSPTFRGLKFRRCRTCRVGVHEECYGIARITQNEKEEDDDDEDFECWACQAVGITVTVRKRDEHGKRLQLQIQERPTECCLCSVDDKSNWYHAMHPIYDRGGSTGRHLVLPPTHAYCEYRPAFAHTLCCMVLNTTPLTSGCIYGCNNKGNYDIDENAADYIDDIDDDDSTASGNPDLSDDNPNDPSVHHFVYSLPKKDGTMDKHSQTIVEVQKELVCKFCGKNDKYASSFRIPIQCCANEDRENEEYRNCHRSKKPCYVAMHVGCAIWGRNNVNHEYPSSRRIFFYPGQRKECAQYSESVTHVYCSNHAEELLVAAAPGARTLRYPPDMPVATLIQNTNTSTLPNAHVSTKQRREKVQSKSRKHPPAKVHPSDKHEAKDRNAKATNKPGAKRTILQKYAKLIKTPEKRKMSSQQGDSIARKLPKTSNSQLISGTTNKRQNEMAAATTASTSNLSRTDESVANDDGPVQEVGNDEVPMPCTEPEVIAPSSQHDEQQLLRIMKKVFKEIKQKERTSDDHLDTIFRGSEEFWNKTIRGKCDVDLFWKKIRRKVSRKLNYSFKPAGWPTLSPIDSLNWDEVKVLQLGGMPSNIE